MTVGLVAVGDLYAGHLRYPGAMSEEVLARYATWIDDLPPAMTSAVVITSEPDRMGGVTGGRRSWATLRGCFTGPVEQGREIVDAWRQWCEPVEDGFAVHPAAWLAEPDDDPSEPIAMAGTTEWLRSLPADLTHDLVAATFGGRDLSVLAEVRHVGHELAPGVGPDLLSPSHLLLRMGVMPGPDGSMRQAESWLRAARSTLADLGVVTGGTYLNLTAGEERRSRTATGFTGASLQRLRQVKAELDPRSAMSLGLDLGPPAVITGGSPERRDDARGEAN
jgi:hypothetical protein